MNLHVTITKQYGNTVVKPTNEAARTLAKIAGTKTLRVIDLAYAEELGHHIVLDGSRDDIAYVASMIDALRKQAEEA
jgi:hypothetical protein